MAHSAKQQWSFGAAVMLLLSQVGALGCATTHPMGGGRSAGFGSHRVVTALPEGGGRYRLVSEGHEVQVVDVKAGGVRRVRKGTINDNPTAWYQREWHKDRAQRRSNVTVGSGDRSFSVLGGRLLGYRETDGNLIESPRLTVSVRELAFIVHGDGADGLLVAAERDGDLALVELRVSDLSVVRELLLPAHPGEGRPSVWVSGDRVFVTALTHQGLCVRTVQRSDLTPMDERHLPVPGPDAPERHEEFRAAASPRGRWLAVHLVERDRVLVVDTATGDLVRDLLGFDGLYGFSDDEHVLRLDVPCSSEACDDDAEVYVPIEPAGDELRLRHDAFAWTQLEHSFVWGISVDLKTVKRWDFAELGREHSYSLEGDLLSAPHDKLDAEYGAEQGRVYNYPLVVAFDRRGQLLVAEWDGRDLRLSRVQERSSESLLRMALGDVEMVNIDVDADALVVIRGDGSLIAFDLATNPVRERARLPAEP
jgi:hypothetical protein